jgi:hypothetical protein
VAGLCGLMCKFTVQSRCQLFSSSPCCCLLATGLGGRRLVGASSLLSRTAKEKEAEAARRARIWSYPLAIRCRLLRPHEHPIHSIDDGAPAMETLFIAMPHMAAAPACALQRSPSVGIEPWRAATGRDRRGSRRRVWETQPKLGRWGTAWEFCSCSARSESGAPRDGSKAWYTTTRLLISVNSIFS